DRHWLNLAGVTRLAEGYHPVDADLLHRLAGRLQVIAGIELFGRLGEHLANRSGDRQAIVGIDVHLPHTVLDAALDLFDRHSPRLLQLPAKLVDDVLQFLRDAARA